MYELKTYDNVPDWIKQLKSGDKVMIYFPRRRRVEYSEVVSNYIPDSSDYMAILTVNYKINKIVKVDELLYDNYTAVCDSDNCWNAFQIV
jgi:predicted Mrr-cat superfamily restriction endonuclease